MKKWYLFVIISLIVTCKQPSELVELSAYFWKTNFVLNTAEENFLKENTIRKLYVRYCDVGLKNNAPIPIAPIEWKDISQLPEEIVPVIYIKNEVFLNENIDIPQLVHLISAYIQQINQAAQIQINEIQIDCDWTLQSRDVFFEFLKQFKNENNIVLSATIRLHQIKYFEKTGIPPVDHAVLMYYNMGTIAVEDNNSIYDRKIAQKYISRLQDYPLRLNIALPIFSWGVHSRENKILNVVGGLRTQDIDTIAALKKINATTFLVTEDYLFSGRLWLKNDRIKVEEVAEKELIEASRDLAKYLKFKPKEIILYDLNSKNTLFYEKQVFTQIRQGY